MRLQHRATVVAARPFMYSCFSFRGWAMKISNVHERTIAAPSALVGALLDTLASVDDKIWPHENWPGVKFNLPLQVGATGGHGTGPYTVSSLSCASCELCKWRALGENIRCPLGRGLSSWGCLAPASESDLRSDSRRSGLVLLASVPCSVEGLEAAWARGGLLCTRLRLYAFGC
jgi:hypothetical protein